MKILVITLVALFVLCSACVKPFSSVTGQSSENIPAHGGEGFVDGGHGGEG